MRSFCICHNAYAEMVGVYLKTVSAEAAESRAIDVMRGSPVAEVTVLISSSAPAIKIWA